MMGRFPSEDGGCGVPWQRQAEIATGVMGETSGEQLHMVVDVKSQTNGLIVPNPCETGKARDAE